MGMERRERNTYLKQKKIDKVSRSVEFCPSMFVDLNSLSVVYSGLSLRGGHSLNIPEVKYSSRTNFRS